MATAVRVTPGVACRTPRHPAVIGVGPFGERVAALLGSLYPGSRPVRASWLVSALGADFDALVVAAWRPVPSVWQQADELAWRQGQPWLAITMEHPVIRIGPLVVPPYGPCFRCYALRRVDHDDQRSATAALRAAYDSDPELGPVGYLPHHARLASGIAAHMLSSLEPMRSHDVTAQHGCVTTGLGDVRPVGCVVTTSLLTGTIRREHVIAYHGCSRCSKPERQEGVAELLACLSARGAIARAEPRS